MYAAEMYSYTDTGEDETCVMQVIDEGDKVILVISCFDNDDSWACAVGLPLEEVGRLIVALKKTLGK